ncbi:MAG TPA: ABC transporter substrate-binding protein [Acidimicrobiales bacterium]|jgi:iron complex transport system substrate-binding protein|nr:ABC transporter substrate-binding protein [Acidimicrobiales bacterium]
MRRTVPFAHRMAAAAVVLAMAGVACGSKDSPTATAPAQSAPVTTPAVSYPLTVTDCGKPVTIPHEPKRVVVDNTAVAEIFFALGLGDRIVAQFMETNLVDALPQYKDQDAKVKTLGGPRSNVHVPSKEVLLSVQPDLVVPSFPKSIDSEGTITTADLTSVGATPVVLSYGCPNAPAILKIDDQFNDVLLIGEIFGVKDKAQKLVDDMKAQLADVQRRVGNLPKPTVASFYVFNGKLSVYGGGIPDEIIRYAGGNNVWTGKNTPPGYAITNISNESFAAQPVDFWVITNLTGISQGALSPQDAFGVAAGLFPTMPAAVNKKWAPLSGHAQQPSLVAVDSIVQLAKALHPEAF